MPWQDQTIFSNLAHAAIKFDCKSGEGFTFCAADTEHGGRECPLFNTLSTEKLKEVVASAKTNFKRQSSKEGEALQDGPDRVWGRDSILVTRDRRDSNYNENRFYQ